MRYLPNSLLRLVPAVLLLLLPAAIQAQSARRVPGYWVGLAPAGASGGLSCDECTATGSRFGPSVVLTIGRIISPSLGIGLDLSGWWKAVNGTVDHQGYLMATTFVFPGRSGAYLVGGVGLARFAAVVGRGGDRTSSLGGAWRVGAGYDLPFGKEISVAPFVSYFRSVAAALKVNGNPTGTDISHHLLQLGVGLNWNFSGLIGFPHPTEH